MNFLEKISLKRKQIIATTIIIVVVMFLIILGTTPPRSSESGITINIARGESVRGAAIKLTEYKIIKYPSFFNFLIFFYDHKVIEGDYYFEKPVNLLTVLDRVTSGDYGLETKNITFFEGITVAEMAARLKNTFPEFDDKSFIELAKGKEGYLFPDTYKFRVNVLPKDVIEAAGRNFSRKIEQNKEVIENSKYSLEQIIIMASIVEKEATADTRQEIADILWRRFENNFLLQVDAPFLYSINKGTFDLTVDDLKSNNPYNTYTKLGLTPTPIGNPGMESILAAANPKPTKYFYFLTGRDGKMYYAETFEGHKKNRLLYLN
jgi:UPF0755 protein